MTDSLMADQGPPVDQPTAQSVLGFASRTLQFCSFEHHKGQVLLEALRAAVALIAAILELEAVAVGAPLFRATRKEPTT